MSKPPDLVCEAKGHLMPVAATHIYGPECEAETGKLMYLCAICAARVKEWIYRHPGRPVDCPTHGRIGKVKNSVILKAI